MLNSSTIQVKRIYSDTGTVIGWQEGDAICKKAYASKHMLQKPLGWAWDVGVLERAKQENLNKSIIYEQEKDLVYQAKLNDFYRYGVKINRGYGEQVCLPHKYWQVSKRGESVERQMELPF